MPAKPQKTSRKYNWDKFHNQQKYSDCQVITAMNAHYYWYGRYIGLDSDEYEELVDIAKARHGSAIDINAVHKKLMLKVVWKGDSLYDFYNHMIEGLKYPTEGREEHIFRKQPCGSVIEIKKDETKEHRKSAEKYNKQVKRTITQFCKENKLQSYNYIMPLPMEWSIWHPRYGFHSTLIIDVSKCPQARRVIDR